MWVPQGCVDVLHRRSFTSSRGAGRASRSGWRRGIGPCSASCSGVVPGSDHSLITSRVPSTSMIHCRFCCIGTWAQKFGPVCAGSFGPQGEPRWHSRPRLAGRIDHGPVVGDGEVDPFAGVPVDGDVDGCRCGEARQRRPTPLRGRRRSVRAVGRAGSSRTRRCRRCGLPEVHHGGSLDKRNPSLS